MVLRVHWTKGTKSFCFPSVNKTNPQYNYAANIPISTLRYYDKEFKIGSPLTVFCRMNQWMNKAFYFWISITSQGNNAFCCSKQMCLLNEIQAHMLWVQIIRYEKWFRDRFIVIINWKISIIWLARWFPWHFTRNRILVLTKTL